MAFQRTLLWINCALFVVFGIGFIFIPAFLSNLITGSTPATTSALIDMRATYGGMALGIAIFFGICARNSDTVRIGLFASALVLSCIALGRIVGIFIDGNPNIFIYLLLSAEILFAALILFALKKD
jgi:hypothetical protein